MSGAGTYRGATLDEALSGACTDLKARIGELHYEVISPTSEEEITVEAEVDPVAVIGLFLSEAFRAGGLDLKVRLDHDVDVLNGELSGGDLRLLTASGGKGLDALQYLCNRVLNRRLSNHPPIHLDSEGFKQRRARKLEEKAFAAAEEALRRRAPVSLGPLTPAARRDIHLALADDPDVETESDGNGFLKRVVIRPVRRR